MNTDPPEPSSQPSSEPHTDLAGLPDGYHLRPAYEVSPQTAAAALKTGKATLIDVRTEAEIAAAPIPGARHIPMHELTEGVEDLELDPDAQIHCICHHGVRSFQATTLLQACGYPNARSVVGGTEAWSRGVDPTLPRYHFDGARVSPIEPVQD